MITAAQAQQALTTADCLYTDKEVETAIVKLANEITECFEKDNPIILCVMNGGLIPTGKLLTHMPFPLQIDYIHATRYRGETRGGELHWLAKPHIEMRDRVVLVVDDILDEGLTLQAILEYCRDQGAADVRSVVLVEKEHDRKSGIKQADFVGLTVPDRYVFGYGMDYKGYLRNAPGIFAVSDS